MSAILTCIKLNDYNLIKRISNNRNSLHGKISSSFTQKDEKKLFYLDEENKKLYILSCNKPNKLHLINELLVNDEDIKYYDYDKFIDNIILNEEKEFSILCNVTMKQFNPEDRKSHIRAIQDEYGQMKWLETHSRENGFTIINCNKREQRYFKCKEKERKLGIRFVGKMKIFDIDKFKRGLLQGLGRGKAYGFGMLLFN